MIFYSDTARNHLVGWIASQRRILLLAMLALMHLILLEDVGSVMDRGLAVMHIGLFFLWQPFVRAEQRLSLAHLAMIGGLVFVSVTSLGPASMMIWTMLLAGIIGGKVFVLGSRWDRLFHLSALAYLITTLLVFLLPKLLPPGTVVTATLEQVASYALPAVFLFMLSLPREREVAERPEMIDFAYSVFVFLLLAVLLLGSVAGMLLANLGYVESLLSVIAIVAIVLLFLGWSWNPRAGFSGLGAFVSRYLLSASLPFELWVEALASFPTQESDPQAFIDWASHKMLAEVSWLNGIVWTGIMGGNAGGAEVGGNVGQSVGKTTRFAQRELTFDLYSQQPLTAAMVWQFNILLQLLEEFYLARVREKQLRDLGYLQAIYETGSRLTHDVKNILQSLNALCAAAAAEGEAGSREFHGLLRRQLPVIAQRLAQTLDKLGDPARQHVDDDATAAGWWQGLRLRYEGQGIDFSTSGNIADRPVSAALLSTVTETLLQNALDKRKLSPGLSIACHLAADSAGLSIQVCDSGAMIADTQARQLGRSPVKSENGLGIGLYQAARMASFHSGRLELNENRSGRVCFRLTLPTMAVAKVVNQTGAA